MQKIILLILLLPLISISQITAPWAFSFDCDQEYVLNQSTSDWNDFRSCESGVGPNVNTQSPGGNYASILYAANNPLGTGLGARQWMAAGKNSGTSGIAFTFTNRLSEFWLRWYFRFEEGFSWGYRAQKKILYFDMNRGSSGSWQVKLSHFETFGFYIYLGSTYVPAQVDTNNFGWDDLMVSGADHGDGHKEADSTWHYAEIHIKYESSLGVSDGIAEMWMDGVKIVEDSTVQFGATDGALEFQAPSNQDSPDVASEMWHDYDDYALSTTGYIGPLASNDTIPPTFTLGLTKNNNDSVEISITSITSDVDSLMYAYPDSATGIDTVLTNTAIDTTIASSGTGWKYLYVKAVDDSGNYTYFGSNVDSVEYFGSSTSAKITTGSGKVILGDGKIK